MEDLRGASNGMCRGEVAFIASVLFFTRAQIPGF